MTLVFFLSLEFRRVKPQFFLQFSPECFDDLLTLSAKGDLSKARTSPNSAAQSVATVMFVYKLEMCLLFFVVVLSRSFQSCSTGPVC